MANNIFRSITLILLILVLLSFFGIASADEFHYNNLLIGDRASGMGGAYTAVSDDATGLYYNPAGIVYSSGKNLSASVNAYYNLTKTYKGVIGGKDWERNSSALLPNYFGVIQPIGKYRFGFSYAVPDSINEDQDQRFYLSSAIPSYIINFNNEDNTYNYGPSFAAELAKDFSAGITLYVHQRKSQFILNQLLTFSGVDQFEWTNTYFELNEWGVRPILGLAWSPVEKISLGLSVSQTFVLSSRATRQDTCSDTTAGGCDNNNATVDPFVRSDARSSEKRKYPTRTALGIAYFASSSLLLAGDVTYFTAVDDPIFGDKEAVVNAALGTEYYLNKNWALRAGLFTNMTNTPEIKAGVPATSEEHIDLYGGSLSISHFTRNTSVTLGGSMSYGKGKAQITSDINQIQDAETFGWTVSLSSSYSY